MAPQDPGDPPAVEPLEATSEATLAARFSRSLRLFAHRWVGDLNEAEDVSQEALRRTVAALRTGQVQDLDALPAFIFQLARNLCLQRRRSIGRQRRAFARLAHGSARSVPPEALEQLISNERRREVAAALGKLDEADRELLRSLFFEEMEPREIAKRLEISPGALRVRKHRALARLKEILTGPARNRPADSNAPATKGTSNR